MGTWATGIYADDEAQDARDAYREILSSGLDGTAATDRFLREWKPLKRKPLFLKRMSPKAKTLWGVIAYKKRDIPYDRMVWLGVRIRPEPDTIHRRWTHESWGKLDENLEQFFGWT